MYVSILKLAHQRPHKIELKLQANLTLLVDLKLGLARRLNFSDTLTMASQQQYNGLTYIKKDFIKMPRFGFGPMVPFKGI